MPGSAILHRCLLSLGLLLTQVDSGRAQDDSSLFQDSVAPILQQRCASCHNDNDRAGDLSLQTASGILENGLIEPGSASSSHLFEVLIPEDGNAAMPKDAPALSAGELSSIRTWIDQGAQWPPGFEIKPAEIGFDWWSFQPIRRPTVPQSTQGWSRTPIDEFVLEKLNQNQLSPSGDADRRTLIRRLYFDLLGLPPTPEETEAFVNAVDPMAYERLVDRLLASPRYGERWARHWLDIVKYADTCGYDKDKLRPNAWPYRDYVIRTFNSDKPYGRFIQEQVAGDALFPGQPDGILGLGFIAAGPWDFIGHVEVPESKIDGQVARNLDRDDMVTNTMNAFCSVTIQCARCHDHKFDPYTQEHYYSLQSVFAAVDRAERPFDRDPAVASARIRLTNALSAHKQELAALDLEMEQEGGVDLEALRSKVDSLQHQRQRQRPPQYGYHSAIDSAHDATKWVEVVLANPTVLSAVILHPCYDDFANIGAGFGFPPRYRVDVHIADSPDGVWTTIGDFSNSDQPNPSLTPVRLDGIGDAVDRVRVIATKLAHRQQDYIFALAELRCIDDNGAAVEPIEVRALDSIESAPRWQKSNLIDGRWPQADSDALTAQLRAAEEELDALMMRLQTPARKRRQESIEREVADIQAQLSQLAPPAMVYAAATDFAPQGNFKPTKGVSRAIHVLHRGDIGSAGQPVHPGTIPLGPTDNWQFANLELERERRAQLAGWLTNTENPFVWRSIANRIWQYHFGTGLVATPNDFGRMGATPSHPELLDWLASELLSQGQSLKHLHRLIVTSSVYRQSSATHAANARIDSDNRFLWRMNRRRLEAEEIRDSILATSGLLHHEMGGPGFYLFQLEHPEHSPHFEYHKFDPSVPASHRRSIYRFVVRSQPDPWMSTLDCADSSQSTPQRSETLTSLQALSLMNSEFVLFCAQEFAEHVQGRSQAPAEQVSSAVRQLLQRNPTPQELALLQRYAATHGLTNMCRYLFNLSEFVYLD